MDFVVSFGITTQCINDGDRPFASNDFKQQFWVINIGM